MVVERSRYINLRLDETTDSLVMDYIMWHFKRTRNMLTRTQAINDLIVIGATEAMSDD